MGNSLVFFSERRKINSLAQVYCSSETDIWGKVVNTVNVKTFRNYYVFGLCPSSGILKTREHSVSETGSVSILR
jgi:hypothetical protein